MYTMGAEWLSIFEGLLEWVRVHKVRGRAAGRQEGQKGRKQAGKQASRQGAVSEALLYTGLGWVGWWWRENQHLGEKIPEATRLEVQGSSKAKKKITNTENRGEGREKELKSYY